MQKHLSFLLMAAAMLALPARHAAAIEVRPAYSAPKAYERTWERGVKPRAYGINQRFAADAPGVYIGADLSYMVADGAQDYPERFGGGSVFLGYRYNRFFSMEVGYSRTLEGEHKTDLGAGIVGKTKSTLQQVSIDAIGALPLNDKLNLIGGLGYGLITEEYESSVSGLGTLESSTEDGSTLRFTGGVEYALSPSASVRGLVRYMIPGDQVNDRLDNIWTYNLGLKYQF